MCKRSFTKKSYDFDHNADNTCEHMEKLIQWMHKENLFTEDAIIYDTTNGCNIQYICENELYLLPVL